MSEAIAIIGLGNAGLSVATALLKHGPVFGYDRSEERCKLARDAGIDVADSLESLDGRASVILLSLPKPEASLAVAGALATWSSLPELVVETSTVTPDTAQKSAAILDAVGVGYVDAADCRRCRQHGGRGDYVFPWWKRCKQGGRKTGSRPYSHADLRPRHRGAREWARRSSITVSCTPLWLS